MNEVDIAAKLALIPKERERLKAELDARLAELQKARDFAIGQLNFEMGRLAEREATLKEMLSPHPVPQEEPAPSADIAG